MIYYKITAPVTNTLTINIEDNQGGIIPVDTSFAIVYSAANINATDNSQLTLHSSCVFSTSTIINVTEGNHYYILVYRDGFDYTNISINMNIDIPISEKNILTDLYNATNGANWTNNNNWIVDNYVTSWQGVTVKNGHVSKINLMSNNLTGSIPSSLNTLLFLEEINISRNSINGELPNFGTISSLNNLDITSNHFSFQDLETHYNSNNSISSFNYQIQNKRDTEDVIDGVLGNNYMLSMTDIGNQHTIPMVQKKV